MSFVKGAGIGILLCAALGIALAAFHVLVTFVNSVIYDQFISVLIVVCVFIIILCGVFGILKEDA